MTILIDETTRQRIVTDPQAGDIIYTKKSEAGNTVITKESKKIVGPWKDYTGSGGPSTRSHLLNPLPNKFEGTDPGILGERLGNLNEVGQNANIYRRRIARVLRKLTKKENSFVVS